MPKSFWMMLAWALLLPRLAMPAPPVPKSVPPELAPWIPWVLDDLGEEVCTKIDERRVCAWPGELDLELGDRGGKFALRVFAEREMDIALPGSDRIWPRDVRLGVASATVLESQEHPVLRVPAGRHEIHGEFRWREQPETLSFSEATAMVSLVLGEQRIRFPRRDAGSIWLSSQSDKSREAEACELRVFRRIDDGVPLLVTTQVALRVSGRSRELKLNGVAIDGGTPLELQADLPVRLENESDVVLELRPGEHSLTLRTRHATPAVSLTAPKRGPPWPDREIWVFQPDTTLRQVELHGPPQIDPSRTDLPTEWKQLQAFSLSPGAALELRTVRRGEPVPPPNQLSLTRDLWLDMNGEGFTVRDQFSGQLSRAWRLDLKAGKLGHARAQGADQLVTVGRDRHSGIELRLGKLDLTAEWRIPKDVRRLPAVGWSEDVQKLSTVLHLPPGWRLLGAGGVDGVANTWLSRWNLFDFFFVLITALAITRLTRPAFGALALGALVLSHDQEGAPYYVWMVLVILIAVLRLGPTGWLRALLGVGWISTVAALAVISLNFAVDQTRAALYPQLAEGTEFGTPLLGAAETPVASRPMSASVEQPPETPHAAAPATGAAPAAPATGAAEEKLTAENELAQAREELGVIGKAPREAAEPSGAKPKPAAPPGRLAAIGGKDLLRQDLEAAIQTGPGVPTWSWKDWQLSWTGPVRHDHELWLWLLSPNQNRAVTLLRLLSFALLGYFLLRTSRAPPAKRPEGSDASPNAKTLAALILLVGLFSTGRAAAEVPPDDVLKELRSRLVRPADCEPQCLSVPHLDVELGASELKLSAEVHAGAAVAYQLPGPVSSWTPDSVSIDGTKSAALALQPDGFLYLRLEPGRHRVELNGPIAGDELTLALGNAPHAATVKAEKWEVDGVREDGSVDTSLHFRRAPSSVKKEGPSEPIHLPPWLLLSRRVEVGPTWTMQTSARRVSPKGTPVTVRVPLLSEEEVTDTEVHVERGEVVVSLGRDADEISWTSRLKPRGEIALIAAGDRPWSEQWSLGCGVMWHCDPRGLAPVKHQKDGVWEPTYRPWPGESLLVSFYRPSAAAGGTLTIDSANLEVVPGTRMLRASLTLYARTSGGGTQVVNLPPGADLQQLSLDGKAYPVQRKGDAVSVAFSPGSHALSLAWQALGGFSPKLNAPRVSVGTEVNNASITIQMPPSRWLLWAGGPSWGPAILFWGYLALVLLAGTALGKIPLSPLSSARWALLGLGLTQVPAPVAVMIAAWFFVVAYRARVNARTAWQHDLLQIGLVFGTLVFLGCLVAAVFAGLVGSPDMSVRGAGSTSSSLRWYLDRTGPALPEPYVVSLPLWVWRVAMLAWALWLATSLLQWLRWAWKEFSSVGIWRPLRRRAAPIATEAPVSDATGAPEVSDAPGGTSG